MRLIDEIIIKNINIKFFDGVDFDLVIKHPKDGSDGFLIFFIESWENEVKIYNRNSRLESVLNNTKPENFTHQNIDNVYISIYQTSGSTINRTIESIYNIIRDKIEKDNLLPNQPWVPVAGINKGKL